MPLAELRADGSTRNISKRDLLWNSALAKIEVDPDARPTRAVALATGGA